MTVVLKQEMALPEGPSKNSNGREKRDVVNRPSCISKAAYAISTSGSDRFDVFWMELGGSAKAALCFISLHVPQRRKALVERPADALKPDRQPEWGKLSDRVLFHLMIYSMNLLRLLLSIFNISSPSNSKRKKTSLDSRSRGRSYLLSPPYHPCCPPFNRAVIGLLTQLYENSFSCAALISSGHPQSFVLRP